MYGETLEEYRECLKDFAHLERAEDATTLCWLHRNGQAAVWSYQAQNTHGEFWTAIGAQQGQRDRHPDLSAPLLDCAGGRPHFVRRGPNDSIDVDLKYNCNARNAPDTMDFDSTASLLRWPTSPSATRTFSPTLTSRLT